MSVLSKALSFAVLTGIAAGCAVSQQSGGQDTAQLSTDDSQLITEYDGLSTAGSDISETGILEEAQSAAFEQTVETEQLADAAGAGFDIRMDRGAEFTRLVIDTKSSPEIDVRTLSQPPRLVVDLIGERGNGSKAFYFDDDQFLETVRLGVHEDKTRLVFDLTDIGSNPTLSEHNVDSENEQVLVTFRNIGSSAAEIAALPIMDTPTLDTPTSDATVAPELPSVPAPEEVAQHVPGSPLMLDALKFAKKENGAGEVTVSLTDESAFELKQTAPSEYVLLIPGATASARTKLPQIAPAGFPGIRSARAVQDDENVKIRMFVDAGVGLIARPAGANILIQAQMTPVAAQPGARAQLGDESAEAADVADSNDDDTAKVNPTGIVSDDGTKIYTGRLISLDLQDTDIDNALRIIAEVSNLNIIASDDVTGKVTLRLIDVPWDQALDVILKTNGLDQVTEGNVIRIAPVEKLRQEREARREALRALENLEELKVSYIRVSYARVTDMQEQVEAVLSERGTVTADERTNQLIVKDIKKGHLSASDLISRLDLRTPQVLLETQIVEGQRSILRDLGFQWNYQYNQGPEFGNATGLNFPNSIQLGGSTDNGNLVDFGVPGAGTAMSLLLDSADGTRQLAARLSALESEGKVKVVSKPQVATVNNKQAIIKSVEKVRIRLPDSGLSVATGSGAAASGGGSSAFEEIDVGIELTVTPQASPDYYVLLDVFAKSSTFGDRTVDEIPSTVEREATSTILVKSGQTFALGGVYRIEDKDDISGVPFLKDIPFLGAAFRRTSVDKSDEELIFFITPHIVEGSFDPSLM